MKKRDIKPVMALLAVAGFYASAYALLTVPERPDWVKDILLILVGAQVAQIREVYGYYFGSSEGSARKTDLLTAPPGPTGLTGPTGPTSQTEVPQ